MNRAEVVHKGASAIGYMPGECNPEFCPEVLVAKKVLAAVLPQVSTAEELEALPFDAKVVDAQGEVWAHYYLATKSPRPLRWRNSRGNYGVTSDRLIAMSCGPLTVVWRPES